MIGSILAMVLSASLALAVLAAPPATAATSTRPFGDNVQFRGSLENSRLAFEQTRKGTVAFLGGSITEMNGYRPMVCALLQKRFPQTIFHFVNAGIASTCSTTGAFRLDHDVLAAGPVNLLFVEFAVNDDQDAHHTRTECIRGMEGIIRHARLQNPNIDIVITYFVNPYMLGILQAGHTPLPIDAHETVANHYDISSINLAHEVADEITAGKLTWETYGGTHPAPAGNSICASMIDELFDRAWAVPLTANARVVSHRLPAPLDPLSYFRGRFIDPGQAQTGPGWTLGIPDWKHLAGATRDQFDHIPMLCSTQPGSSLMLEFDGTAVGAYIVAGPDAGIAEASIDSGPLQSVNLYHEYSAGLHYPCSVMFGVNLKPGNHKLNLTISNDTHTVGHAMRIMEFEAN